MQASAPLHSTLTRASRTKTSKKFSTIPKSPKPNWRTDGLSGSSTTRKARVTQKRCRRLRGSAIWLLSGKSGIRLRMQTLTTSSRRSKKESRLRIFTKWTEPSKGSRRLRFSRPASSLRGKTRGTDSEATTSSKSTKMEPSSKTFGTQSFSNSSVAASTTLTEFVDSESSISSTSLKSNCGLTTLMCQEEKSARPLRHTSLSCWKTAESKDASLNFRSINTNTVIWRRNVSFYI